LHVGDGHELHIEANSSRDVQINISEFWIYGRNDYRQQSDCLRSNIRGPYNLSPDGQFYLQITVDGGASQEIQVSQAAFASACGYTVNLAEIHTWELADLINANFKGAGAWGEGDDSYVYLRTMNLGPLGTIKVETATTGTDANTKIGWATTLAKVGSVTQMAKDSGYFVDWTTSVTGGTSVIQGNTFLTLHGLRETTYSTSVAPPIRADTAIAHNDISKRYNSSGPGAYGQQVLENIAGLSKSNGVPPKNFWTAVTISEQATSGVWKFAASEEDENYEMVVTPVSRVNGPAAGSDQVMKVTKNKGSFFFEVAAAPGPLGSKKAVNFVLMLLR